MTQHIAWSWSRTGSTTGTRSIQMSIEVVEMLAASITFAALLLSVAIVGGAFLISLRFGK